MLTHKTLPEFGVVDVLVENGLQELDDSFYADLVGPCFLAVGGGRIDVMPAFGVRSRANPAEVLAKLSRAYTEDIATSGTVATIRDQVSSLIDRYASPQQYDAIFVDARAGLNETSASAVTGLGAEVFLFGRDEEQSFEGYSFLFWRLSRLIPPNGPQPEWTERLTPVQAFAPVDSGEREAFRVRWEEMVRRSGMIAAQAEQPAVRLPDGFSEIPWADDERDENVLLPPFPKQEDASEQDLVVALEKIFVMSRRGDDRLDMPDLFRVAAKLLKKGAPAPL